MDATVASRDDNRYQMMDSLLLSNHQSQPGHAPHPREAELDVVEEREGDDTMHNTPNKQLTDREFNDAEVPSSDGENI